MLKPEGENMDNRTLTDAEVKELTDAEVKEAFSYHCQKMGSLPYYYADEIERWKAHPQFTTVYREGDTGKLRAYTDGRFH